MIYTSFSFIRFLLGTGFVPNPVLDIRMTQMAETVPTLGKILVQRSHGTQLLGGECRDSWREAGKRCKSRQTHHNCSGGEVIYLFWGYGAEERRLGGLKLLFSLLGVWGTTIKNLPMSSNPHGWKANQDSGLHGKSFCHHPPPPCQSGRFCLFPHDDVLPKLMSYPFPPRVHLDNPPNKRHSPLKTESYSVLLGVLGTWAQVLLRLNWLTAQSHLPWTLLLDVWKLTYLGMSLLIYFTYKNPN